MKSSPHSPIAAAPGPAHAPPRAIGSRPAVEWPTVIVAIGVYGAYLALTLNFHALPWWLLLFAGGCVVAVHGSLQHEVVHGHPTRWGWLNEALVTPSLWLWLPFRHYRGTHLRHHRNEWLTDPFEDPETHYVTRDQWDRMSELQRSWRYLLNTVVGRLVLGPLVAVADLLREQLPLLLKGDGRAWHMWGLHLLGCVPVLYWVLLVCEIPLWQYVLLFAWPGLSLTMLRSYLEHQRREEADHRTAIVEGCWFTNLLYLNNNYHLVHHDQPGLAWYRIPAEYRRRRSEWLARNANYAYQGYWRVVLQYLCWPKETPVSDVAREPRPRS